MCCVVDLIRNGRLLGCRNAVKCIVQCYNCTSAAQTIFLKTESTCFLFNIVENPKLLWKPVNVISRLLLLRAIITFSRNNTTQYLFNNMWHIALDDTHELCCKKFVKIVIKNKDNKWFLVRLFVTAHIYLLHWISFLRIW